MAHSDVPLHLGFAHVGGKLTLDFPSQVTAWCRQLAGDSGEEVHLLITKRSDEKTRAQEKGFHAMLTPWAKERGWRIDALKQVLLKQLFGTYTFVNPQSGEEDVVLAEPHTSKLTKQQYSDLIEGAMEMAAHDGYFLIAPDEYLHAKQQARKKAERNHRKGATS